MGEVLKRRRARKAVEHFLGWLGLEAVGGFARVIPENLVHGYGGLVGLVAYLLSASHRRLALRNLRLVFASKTSCELRQLAFQNYWHISEGLCEGLRSPYLSSRALRSRITVEGKENLDRALSAGRGVIAVTGHFGNFGLLGHRLAVDGYRFHFVFRYPDSRGVARHLLRALRRQGVGVISALPRRECVRRSIECLRGNDVVCIIADQREGEMGVPVSFLGHPTRAAAGPAMLALRTGAALVPVFIYRCGSGKHRLRVLPPIEHERVGNLRTDVEWLTGRINGVIEKCIMEYPEQWWWVHRRW